MGEYRPATQQEQRWNTQARRDTVSGFRGVYRAGEAWLAEIRYGGARRYLGTYDTPEEAAAAFEAEARKVHGAFYSAPKYAAQLDGLTPRRHSRQWRRLKVGAERRCHVVTR